MKRYMIVGIAVVAILGIAAAMALASNPQAADNLFDGTAQIETVSEESGDAATAVTQDPAAAPVSQTFVDEDGDGVCDTCGNVPGTGAGNQNGNGASGDNFVDLDGDGICDDCQPLAAADGSGNQYGRQGGQGGQGGQGAAMHQSTTQLDGATSQSGNGASGDNFVDEDGDGICDDCAPLAPADGSGNQYGRQGGQGQRSGRWSN